MTDLQKWKTLRTEMVLDHRWYKVRREAVQLPNGSILDDYFVSVRPEVALVFPVTAEGEVITVRQYKHGAREILLELPGGVCDLGEPPETAARRELLEETGYEAGRLTHLATLHDDPTKNTNRFHLFLAQDVRLVREQALDVTENIRVERVPLREMKNKVLNREIQVANSVAVTFLALEKLAQQG
jgi:8-oxo-dGTP pyrophosphatase MutT (NUDIX family)